MLKDILSGAGFNHNQMLINVLNAFVVLFLHIERSSVLTRALPWLQAYFYPKKM